MNMKLEQKHGANLNLECADSSALSRGDLSPSNTGKHVAHTPGAPFSFSPGGRASVSTILTIVTLSILTGCAVGPNYKRPEATATPAQYKAGELGSWKQGQPLDNIPKGQWWEIFNDPTLNDLQRRTSQSNQALKGAMARVEQARATARVARGELLPRVDLGSGFTRRRTSENAFDLGPTGVAPGTTDEFRVGLDLSYEVDLWGRVRRSFEASRADAQGTLSAFYNVLLTLHSDVAQNYFGLRALDAEVAIVNATVEWRKEQTRLIRSRFEGGIGTDLDVARAETELATAEAEAASIARRRTELENAIAILVGENPSTFKLAPLPVEEAAKTNTAETGTNTWQPPTIIVWNPTPPEIPAGLPSDLLERRPDVSEAERQLAAFNARIGVAKAAFFPVLSLTASGGYLSAEADDLFDWTSRAWSIGPSLSLPIFAGGRNMANYRRSQAAYDEAVARYRQQVLVAFGDIENSLSGIRYLADQYAAQRRAVDNSKRAAHLAGERYRFGIVSFLEVVDANREALLAERGAAQLVGQRQIAAVQLIKALGGGWTEQEVLASRSVAAGQEPKQ
jgi:multidrug efflux system outer membrane protein